MNKKKLNLFLLIFFTFVLVFSCTLVFLSFTTSEVKAESLDPESTIQVGFPFYAGKDSLISSNLGDLPYFNVPYNVTSSTFTFSNNNYFSFTNFDSTYYNWFYTRNVTYKNINYTPLYTNFMLNNNTTVFHVSTYEFQPSTTYTFSMIIFDASYIYNYTGTNAFSIGLGGAGFIDSLSRTSLGSPTFSNPYLYYYTFTTPSDFNNNHFLIYMRGNLTYNMFLVEGSSPTFTPANNKRSIFDLSVPNFTFNVNTDYTFLNNSTTYYSSTLTISDESSYADFSNVLSRGDLSCYVKFSYSGSSWFVPCTLTNTTTGFKLIGTHYFRNDSTLVSSLIFTLSVSQDTILNIKFYRSDNESTTLNLSNIKFYVDYYLDTYSSNLAYNSGFLDGANSLSDTISNLNDTISSQRTQLQALNDLIESNTDYSFFSLFSSIFDAPVKTAKGLLNFSIFGMDMYAFFTALLTLTLILFVWRVFIKGG